MDWRLVRTGDRQRPRDETRRLAGLGGGVLLLHVLGWGLFVAYAPGRPAFAGLGGLAYVLGLRHAFDADHIAAIDNTTRSLLQRGRGALGVGFSFSLGHATVVVALTAALALAARAVEPAVPAMRSAGGLVGTTVSGTFLVVIGLVNLIVLVDLVRIARGLRDGGCDEAELERRLADRGALGRVLLGRVAGRIDASWKMYAVGLLFGLGFDTATEVGLMALAAGVATHDVPFLAVMSLPLVFAAGMSLADTADGVFMTRAYGWALERPVRRVFYNLTVTTVSVAVALVIGTIELLQVAAARLGREGGAWDVLAAIDLGSLGYVVAALLAGIWGASVLVWRLGRIEERWGGS